MDTRDEMAAIREIQRNLQILYKDGYSLPYVGVDGIYGDATADAVSDFQYIVGIEPTGVVDLTPGRHLWRRQGRRRRARRRARR